MITDILHCSLREIRGVKMVMKGISYICEILKTCSVWRLPLELCAVSIAISVYVDFATTINFLLHSIKFVSFNTGGDIYRFKNNVYLHFYRRIYIQYISIYSFIKEFKLYVIFQSIFTLFYNEKNTRITQDGIQNIISFNIIQFSNFGNR